VAEIKLAQKEGDDGFYLKVDALTGEVVKKKTTPGPYKGIPMYELVDSGLGEENRPSEIIPTPKIKVEKFYEDSEEEEEAGPEEDIREENRPSEIIPTPKIKVEEIPQRAFISLDDSISKIVYLDQEGVDLFFEDEPEKFRELPEEVFKSLRKINQERYKASFDFHKRRVREQEHPEEFKTPGVEMNPAYTTARSRLKVEGVRPGFTPVWKTPHELTAAARLGYRIARYPGLKSFANEGDEIHKVSAFGEDELILTEIENERRAGIIKHYSDKSRKRVSETEERSAAEIRSAGGIPFKPGKQPDGRNWTRTPGSPK
jgi:hypothetical protein